MSKKRKQIVTNPLTQWLLEYVDEHDVSLTELSVRAGLSAGSLRSLVKFPERLPSLETCMKLAEVTGKAPEEIFQMAGLNGATPTMALNPDRLALVRIYDSLPAPLRQGLVQVARSIQQLNENEPLNP